jgi:hypothetical protein
MIPLIPSTLRHLYRAHIEYFHRAVPHIDDLHRGLAVADLRHAAELGITAVCRRLVCLACARDWAVCPSDGGHNLING